MAIKFIIAYLIFLTGYIGYLQCQKETPLHDIDIKFVEDKEYEVKFIGGKEKSGWIDLQSVRDISIGKGQFALIPLGVAMRLPKGYEALIVPRSSTYFKHKIIQTNSCGVIDNAYSGDKDEWKMPVYATEDTFIPAGTRLCQFRLMKIQDDVKFNKVQTLGDSNRGGFGSTGK